MSIVLPTREDGIFMALWHVQYIAAVQSLVGLIGCPMFEFLGLTYKRGLHFCRNASCHFF